MKVLSLSPASGAFYPSNLLRLDYQSNIDAFKDWALLSPGENLSMWIVVLHGHGSAGDQLYTRQDIRDAWLPKFQGSDAGILTVHLRGNAWMNPAAAADLHELLHWMRIEQGLERTLFYSGSMGGTSNLIYAVLHPEDVSAVVALGAATDIGSYYSWCHGNPLGTTQDIAMAIHKSYGEPSEQKVLFERHSVLKNASRLSMPVYLAHGAADILMPVQQARDLTTVMQGKKNFSYHEIPQGNHDAPLWDKGAWEFAKVRLEL